MAGGPRGCGLPEYVQLAATLQAAFAAAAESTHEFSTGFMSFPLRSVLRFP